ncbi:Hypothetical protein PHPALM_8910 [Phytophthora palmivora]|uniref:Uncharacterized protein n=1 Tax=Phytophthora palmivora TaxID=4796 RepID=A0A2P4Y8N4_9STRA|nr:Hypothetical protein PHPALM_8910 [Phytophthora palmivora]
MHSMNIIRIKFPLTLLHFIKDHGVQLVRRWLYFFIPKERWRKIAHETRTYRLESIDEIAQTMRARARARRETTPSTIVLSVEEHKAKLQRENPIQQHEIVRFIGLLIARTLEPRR